MNKYLMDRASRRSMRDGRNPYGSRGGYVTSRRGRGRDRMGNDYNYSEYDSRYDDRMDYTMGNQDGHYGYERYGEYNRPMDYEMYGYGIGGIRPRMDYESGRGRSRMRDMRYDGRYDYASEDMEKEYKEDLHEWIEKLKKKDKFSMSKEQTTQHARQVGADFKDYTEEEFYAIYLAMVSDYKNMFNDPTMYLRMAKDWLEDDDVAMKGSEKVCAYLYAIVLGEED